MASSTLFHSSCVLFPQLLSRGSVDVPVLLAEVTQAQEAVAVVEATHVMTMLAAKTSAQEPTVVWDSTALRVRDALAALHHTEMAGELALLRVTLSCTMSRWLGIRPVTPSTWR
jgi:hypothetical protein